MIWGKSGRMDSSRKRAIFHDSRSPEEGRSRGNPKEMKGGRQSSNAVLGAQSVNLNRLGQAGEKKKKEKKKEKGKTEQQPARKGAQTPTPSLRQLVTSDHSYHTKGSVKTGQTLTRNCSTEREGQPPTTNHTPRSHPPRCT